jgi:hypothetical protein
MPEVPISRPTPPRAEDYAVVLGSQGPRRDFRISVGLREGWHAEGLSIRRFRGGAHARARMKRRLEAGHPALSGMYPRGSLLRLAS